jgi:hypothetical protein
MLWATADDRELTRKRRASPFTIAKEGIVGIQAHSKP